MRSLTFWELTTKNYGSQWSHKNSDFLGARSLETKKSTNKLDISPVEMPSFSAPHFHGYLPISRGKPRLGIQFHWVCSPLLPISGNFSYSVPAGPRSGTKACLLPCSFKYSFGHSKAILEKRIIRLKKKWTTPSVIWWIFEKRGLPILISFD